MDRNSAEYKAIEREMGMPADAESLVSFRVCAELNHSKSDELQRPIFEDHPYFVHRAKGISDFTSRRATEADIEAYPQEWAMFLATRDDISITCIPGIKHSEIEMLRCRRIHTVKDAAELNDPHPEIARAVMSARRWMAIESGEKPRIKLVAA